MKIIASEPSFFNTLCYQANKNINPPRVNNTCGWFLDHPTFQKWKNSSHDDILWLSAGAGCGKSVLSKALIDEKLVGDKRSTICYFFFKDNEEQNSVATAICALLHQLFCTHKGLFLKYAETAIKEYGEPLKRDFETLWQLWISTASNAPTKEVICILDAIDECKRQDWQSLLRKLELCYATALERQSSGPVLKFIITSRPHEDINRLLNRLSYQYSIIHLSGEKELESISHEIDIVMNAKVDEIVKERGLTDEIREALKRRFSETHNTTYLWLHLMLEELRDSLDQTKKKLLQCIDDLPESIENAYESILQRRIQNKRHAMHLLEIIVAACRPLHLSEIDVALEIHGQSTSLEDLDVAGSDNRKRWIRGACGVFVNVIDSHVYLIHQTAREFLLRQADETSSPGKWRHSIDLQNAHLQLSIKCIAYLLLQDFKVPILKITKISAEREKYPFLVYSARYWVDHVNSASTMKRFWLQKAFSLCNLEPYPTWCTVTSPTIMNLTSERHSYWGLPLSLERDFIFAIRLGLIQVIKMLLDAGEALITEYVVEAAASDQECGPQVLSLFLDQADGSTKVTQEVLEAIISNQKYGKSLIMLVLQRVKNDVLVTASVVHDIHLNEKCGRGILMLLLDPKRSNVFFTENAMTKIIQLFDVGVIKLLYRRLKRETILNIFIYAAMRNKQCGKELIKFLLDKKKYGMRVTSRMILATSSNDVCGKDIIMLLLNQKGSNTLITGAATEAILRNFDLDVIKFHYDQAGDKKTITRRVAAAAVRNEICGKQLATFLLDRAKYEIMMSEQVLMAAARNPKHGKDIMTLLVDRIKGDMIVSEPVLISAAKNPKQGKDVMTLLLDQIRSEMMISEQVLIVAAENPNQAKDIMTSLLDRVGGDGFFVTENMIQSAVGNPWHGADIMTLFLDRGSRISEITESITMTILRNRGCGEDIMRLLHRRGHDVGCTSGVILAWYAGLCRAEGPDLEKWICSMGEERLA
jgi:hypothetical protein